MRSRLIIWSVEIVGGAHDLLQLVENDEQALSKVGQLIWAATIVPNHCSVNIIWLDG